MSSISGNAEANAVTHAAAAEAMVAFRAIASRPNAVARAIVHAMEQPADVDVGEVIVRPVAGSF